MDLSSSAFWITLLTQVGIMLGLFLLNVMILTNLVFKPTLKLLAERNKKLSGLNEESKKIEASLQRKLGEYQGIMEEARQIARMQREDILKHAEKEKNDLVLSARAEAETQLSQARVAVTRDAELARKELRLRVQDLAKEIVAKVLGKKAA